MSKVPLIYSHKYNITLVGIQNLHPFDSEKYRHVHQYLLKNTSLGPDDFYEPAPADDELLLKVHTREYLDSLKDSRKLAEITELPLLKRIPNPVLQKKLLEPMRYATGGTVLGVDIALEHGWAVNLSGGYHHAKADSGGGFCYFADIPLAAVHMKQRHPGSKVLVVDLDAHQGNGVESILRSDPNVYIMDVYNKDAYPWDRAEKDGISLDIPVAPGIGDREYLQLVSNGLDRALTDFNPDLVIYNAGTDVIIDDPLGELAITPEGIIERDCLVFEMLMPVCPVLMLLAGGYTRGSAGVIGASIKKLLKTLL